MVAWDSVNKGSGVVLSNDDMTATITNANNTVRASKGKNSGKWYWEIRLSALGVGGSVIGIVNGNAPLNAINLTNPNVRFYYNHNGYKMPENVAYGATYGQTDVIRVLLDLDTSKGSLWFFKNGNSQGVSHYNIKSLGMVYPAVSSGSSSAGNTCTVNFGETPFVYPIPAGYEPYNNFEDKSLILHDSEYKKWNEEKGPTPSTVTAIPIMTSNTAPSGKASASAAYSSSYDAYKAFSSAKTGWVLPERTLTGWLEYEFPNPTRIIGFSMVNREPYGSINEMPRTWVFEAWNGSEWVALHVQTTFVTWSAGVWQSFYFENKKQYRRYRINADNTGTGRLYITIGQLKMFEAATEAIPAKWSTVSSVLPTTTHFIEEGMDLLTPLFDRKLVTLKSTEMTDKSEILDSGEEGKEFSYSLNLKRLIDIRSIKNEVM